MSVQSIIRAWKDETYRNSLSEAERAALPENPAGLIELTDADLDATAGGRDDRDGDTVSPIVCSLMCSFSCPTENPLFCMDYPW